MLIHKSPENKGAYKLNICNERLLIEPDRKLSFRELMNSRCGMEDADDSAQVELPMN